MRALRAFAAVLLATAATADERGLPFHTVYGPESWQGGAMVYAAVRDARGVMLFGTEDAVVEFDGASWRRLEIPGRSAIRALALGDTEAVYAGGTAEFGVLEPDGRGGRAYRSLSATLPADLRAFKAIWSIQVAPQGVFFVSSELLLLRRPDGSFASWRPAKQFHKAFLLEGVLYVRDTGRGLVALRGGVLELVTPVFADDGVHCLLPWDGARALACGNRSGLHVVDLRSGAVTRPEGFDALSRALAEGQLFHGVTLASGRVAFSTLLSGVFVAERDGTLVERLQSPRIPLRGEFAHVLVADGDDLWFAMNNGIAYLETGAPLRYWDRSAGFRGTNYGAERFEGRLYFASGLTVTTPEEGRLREIVPTLPAWAILRFRGARERLLIGTINGLFEMVDGTPRLVSTIEQSGNVFGLYQTPSSPIVWVSTRRGLFRVREEGAAWREDGFVPGLAEEVRAVHQDADGALWIALLHGGVARLDGERLTRLGTAQGLPVEGGVSVTSYGRETVFLTESGVYRFDSGRFVRDVRFEAAGAVHRFVEAAGGDVWAAAVVPGGHRLARLRRTAHGFVREDRPFSRLPVMPIESLFPEPDGTLWVGGKEGIFRVDTQHPPSPSRPPPVRLRRVTVNGAPATIGPPIDGVPYAGRGLVFEWACPFPVRPVEYRTRLDGESETWSGWSTATRLELSRLPEGRYVFRVEARTFDGVVAPAAAQAFTILPPWHRTPLARFLQLLLVAAIAAITARLNTIRLRRDKQRLEQIVEQRTGELREANADLALRKREVDEKNESITAGIRYAWRIQRATLPSEAEAARWGEIAVLYEPRDIVSGDFWWLAERAPYRFMAVADCTGHGVPGALLTMLGSTSLDDVVLAQGIVEPGRVLAALHRRVSTALRQEQDAEASEGLEIALVRLGPDGVVFAGARLAAYVVGEGGVQRVRGDREPIGGTRGGPERTFAEHVLPVGAGATIVLATDGVVDQLGIDGRRLGTKAFEQQLGTVVEASVEAQVMGVRTLVRLHRADVPQTDDITMVAVRVEAT